MPAAGGCQPKPVMRGSAAGVPSLQSGIAWVVADGAPLASLNAFPTRYSIAPEPNMQAADRPFGRRAISEMASIASFGRRRHDFEANRGDPDSNPDRPATLSGRTPVAPVKAVAVWVMELGSPTNRSKSFAASG
jgi:hypothetical protein